MPALSLHTAAPYVAGAYLVFLALILVYVGIMSGRLARIERELGELTREATEREDAARAAAGSTGADAAGPARVKEPA